ncbi:MAG: hypothetical protein HQK63_05675 [Desulfamplus sp.]|nr:hypothetical protein [Desulfamplus sp.]
MITKSPLEKRVKRRITARTHRFFAVCPPGLKRMCHKEIIFLSEQILNCEFQDIVMLSGGVEFTSTVQGCYAANLYLRTPSRILMRITKFKAENFRTLEKKLTQIEWELYLKPSLNVHVEVSTNSSRLYHTDAIAQRAEKAIKEKCSDVSSVVKINSLTNIAKTRDNEKTKIAMQTIMIRGENDLFEVSIDSSGELLHKRGLKENVGVAPIRETIAFAILSAMKYPESQTLISGDNSLSENSKIFRANSLPLIDGMCGSGTFALEAAMVALNIPAGFFRQFAFEDWQCFSKGQWDYMKKRASENIIIPDALCNNPFIFGVDQDPFILQEFEKMIQRFKFSSAIKTVAGNFLDILPEKITNNSNKGFVVLNPPYGKRIGENEDIEKIFFDIGRKLKSDFKGWRAGVIIPDKKFITYLHGRKSIMPIFHGGLEIYAVIVDC